MKLNKQYLIALDIDGTLLTDKKTISYKTRNIIKTLEKNRSFVILSSGRPVRTLLPIYNKLKLKTPMVCYNGAYVFNPNDEAYTGYKMLFKKEEITKIINDLPKNVYINIMAETNTKIYFDIVDNYLFHFFNDEHMDIKVGDLTKIIDEDTFTFICHYNDTPENREIILNTVKKHSKLLVRFWNDINYFELYYPNVGKYKATCKIAEYYNIKKDNIYAFGDSDNDIEVITQLKNGVAMKNGCNELLSKAKHITNKDNNHNGIADYLKKNLK